MLSTELVSFVSSSACAMVRATAGVTVKPGSTAFTRTPYAAYSAANMVESSRTAAFSGPYNVLRPAVPQRAVRGWFDDGAGS